VRAQVYLLKPSAMCIIFVHDIPYTCVFSPSREYAGRRSKTEQGIPAFPDPEADERSPASLAWKADLSFVRAAVGRGLNFAHNVMLTFFFLVLDRSFGRAVGFTGRRTARNCNLPTVLGSRIEGKNAVFSIPCVSSYLA